MQSEEAPTGLYSRYQGSSWDGQTQSVTPDDGLYHPGQRGSGDQKTQTSATGNGISYSGQSMTGGQWAQSSRPDGGVSATGQGRPGSQGTNGWSQDGSLSQSGGTGWNTAGTVSGGQWSQGTTPGGSVPNAGQASVGGKQPQAGTATSSLRATQSTSTTQLAQTPTPSAGLYLEGQNNVGNGNGGQLSADGSLSQAGVATPDDGLYHPEYANANGQGAQQWTSSDSLYYPGEWSPGSATKPTSTPSRPEGTATQLSSPLPSSSITSKPTATNDSSSSTTTNSHDATKIAVPVSVGVVAAAMAGVILWWLYRKSQAAKAARKRNNSLEEGDYMKDDGPSLLKRSVATLGGYSLFKPSWKRTRVASHASMCIDETPCNKYGDHVEGNETRAPGETNLYDLEKQQPPENTASTETLASEGPRHGDIAKPNPALRDETSSISTSTRVCTPPSLPGVPEEPEDHEEHEAPSRPITPVDSQAAVGEVFSVEIGFTPVNAKQIELKQGQNVTVSKVYDDGWALCHLPESKAEGLAPRACLSASPLQGKISGSGNPMQHSQYNISQFSFSSQSTGLCLDGGQPSNHDAQQPTPQ
ncbi:hypothetical protein ABOM_007381 [Aspergillus bombycis]|uniref:SH3 domain-containing protein n=1 Tax=Aspergillus bombycis TaxID=109264 RepID=A0A1F7ZZ72_9EURO|nr:hypothetical protein ABOM_007381 [Aspergillus bombycis]OGM44762.1 hypothetical protein ABOM_007381 [Aspergillus bombycis]